MFLRMQVCYDIIALPVIVFLAISCFLEKPETKANLNWRDALKLGSVCKLQCLVASGMFGVYVQWIIIVYT